MKIIVRIGLKLNIIYFYIFKNFFLIIKWKWNLGVGIKYIVFNYFCYKIVSLKYGYLIKY